LKAAKRYNISGYMFIADILNLIDIPSMEYEEKDPCPRTEYNDKQLYRIIKAAYEVLKRNKERWI
jgi:hypothetical protein